MVVRVVIARCTVDYQGRLTAHLPEAVRMIMVKADGCVSVHADGGGVRRGLTDRGFDLVVVDPAKQASNRTDVTKALRYYEDLAEREAAAVLGCSTGAFHQLVTRATTSLRAHLAGDDR